VAHSQGRVRFIDEETAQRVVTAGLAPLQYVDNYHRLADRYPYNPNGSAHAIASLTSRDGRATILMPHPERAFMNRQLYGTQSTDMRYSYWMRLFQNARAWTDRSGTTP